MVTKSMRIFHIGFLVSCWFIQKCGGRLTIDQRRCDQAIDNLNLEDSFDCKCKTSRRRWGGLKYDFKCENPDGNENYCFGNLFCGAVEFNLTYDFPGGTDKMRMCYTNSTVEPGQDLPLYPNFCIQAKGARGFARFSKCTAEVENEDCTCEVCEGGRSFTIRCQDGPQIECFGFRAFKKRHPKRTAAPWTPYPRLWMQEPPPPAPLPEAPIASPPGPM